MRIALPARIDAGAVARHDPGAAVVDLAGDTMGTTWSVRLVPPRGRDVATLRAAIVARLDGIVAEMSQWLPGSLLSRFNRAAAATWTVLPPDFAHVVAHGLAIAAATDGAFDPAIGRLVDLWGFGPVAVAGPPDDATIALALRVSGWRQLRYDAPARRLWQPGGLSLDLAGIAKGYAVDAVADLLAAHGVRDALVEIGGELAGRGLRPDGEPWWVDLEPPPGIALPPFRIALHGLAVATSGTYRRGDHSLDPRTGRPVADAAVSVSVVHTAAMTADAWATALTVAGDDAPALAADHRIAARIVSRGTETITPALAAMLAD